jgi:hypothetical protein
MDDSEVDSPALVTHLEARLGGLVYGWSKNPGGEPMPFQVARFEGGRYANVLSYATIGLSHSDLTSSATGRPLRMELVLALHEDVGERNVPALLQQVGLMALTSGRALLRGDAIELGGSVISGTSMTALYAMLPVYFDDDFASCVVEDGREAAIVWLVPIHPSESEFIEQRGWQAFEELVQDQDPDLFDPRRLPVIADAR